MKSIFDLFAEHIHHEKDCWRNAPAWAIELRQMQAQLNERQGNIMAEIDDLVTAIGDLKIALDTNNAEIETLLGKISAPGATAAQIAAATQSIRDIIATNKAEVDKAVAATP